jgi:CRISPR-associated endonuclease/helicase Cas3
MISDLAPIDLLIQRAGRLHRHAGRVRPPNLAAPQLFVAIAQKPDDMPDLEADVYIYEPLILYRSYLVLQGKQELVLPQETAPLIERVYGEAQAWAAPLTAEMEAALEKAQELMRKHNEKADHEASKRLVLPPTYKQLLFKRNEQLEEEDVSVHQSLQALTRLGPPTVALVCLYETSTGLNSEPDGRGLRINEKERPDAETTQSLARCTISINHQGIVRHLLNNAKPPTCWNDHSLLRNNHYLLRFQNNVCRLEGSGYSLRLTKAYGLEIIKEEP